jgi:hypothetical protein
MLESRAVTEHPIKRIKQMGRGTLGKKSFNTNCNFFRRHIVTYTFGSGSVSSTSEVRTLDHVTIINGRSLLETKLFIGVLTMQLVRA